MWFCMSLVIKTALTFVDLISNILDRKVLLIPGHPEENNQFQKIFCVSPSCPVVLFFLWLQAYPRAKFRPAGIVSRAGWNLDGSVVS